MFILKNKWFYFSLGFLFVGLFIGYLLPGSFPDFSSAPSEFHADLQKNSTAYQLINPLYECNTGENYGIRELSSLKSKINDYINQLTANNSVSDVSVYYRDLNSGPWFGINQHDVFTPSSLLKLPVMMAYYKMAEADPSVLTKKIKYSVQPDGVIAQNYQTNNPIVLGQVYTVEQLIESMIIGSDNVALRLLENNIDNKKIDQITIDLGITTATNSTPDDFMDVQEYATLFRVLYYSTYLNKDYSEKSLELLSQAEFKQGLVANLPKNITVAHKFGEREVSSGVHQLHDCGIVYYPNHPYLLCVMTKGPSFNDLATTIQQISGKVYSEAKRMYH